MKALCLRLAAFVIALLSVAGPAYAQLFETKAKQAFLVDAGTGTVLFSKNADELIPPASLAKLMTMEVVFSRLKSGSLTMDEEFLVSENAWRTGGAQSGGSTMFAKLKSSIRLEDLIRGVIIQSANDGCIVIAEGIAGTEETFAQVMTDRARQIGLEKSVFRNSTGLPDPQQLVTARELTELAMHIYREYPDYYKFYSETSFTWNGITQPNRNPLLAMNIGADGMKTGYTEESGYGIIGSLERNGRRLFATLSGMSSMNERAEEARKLLEWGLRAFEQKDVFGKDDVVGSVRLYGGEKTSVDVKGQGAISMLVPIANRDRIRARIVYDGPVPAPVNAGQRVATLKVWIGDDLFQETPLVAAESVAKGPLHRQALDALGELLLGWM